MDEKKLSYSDVAEYETLFTLAPSFLLERFAKRNTNLVSKFKSIIESYMNELTEDQKAKLHLILSSKTEDLQSIMHESYLKSNVKQYKILANPEYKQFIEDNLNEIREMIYRR